MTDWVPPDTHELTGSGGQVLSYCLYGPRDGLPVVAQHGTPGIRWERPDVVEAIDHAGLRVLLYDRPGYGGSARRPGRVVADAAADVRSLADAVGWERFAVTGFSGGGPHALACAALLPDRVIRCATVASLAPSDAPDLEFLDPATLGKDDGFHQAARGEWAMRGHVERRSAEVLSQVCSPAQAHGDVVGPADDSSGRVRRMEAMCLAGLDGWVDDYLAFVRPWGFDVRTITVPVSIWHGLRDDSTPQGHSVWLAANVPGARLFEHPGGHDPDDADYRRMLAWLDACR